MKAAILGSGAIGSFVGSGLLKGGADVWFVDKYKDHVDAINKNGLIVETKDKTEVLKAKATSTGAEAGVCDVVIILVKGPQTRSSIEEYKERLKKVPELAHVTIEINECKKRRSALAQLYKLRQKPSKHQ